MIFYITKHIDSLGIVEIEAEYIGNLLIKENNNGTIYRKPHFHEEKQMAIEHGNGILNKKIKSLNRKISKDKKSINYLKSIKLKIK